MKCEIGRWLTCFTKLKIDGLFWRGVCVEWCPAIGWGEVIWGVLVKHPQQPHGLVDELARGSNCRTELCFFYVDGQWETWNDQQPYVRHWNIINEIVILKTLLYVTTTFLWEAVGCIWLIYFWLCLLVDLHEIILFIPGNIAGVFRKRN